MRKHNADEMETIEIYLSETHTPIAFQKKVDELIENGLTADEAKQFVRTTPILMEMYYEKNAGLFMVEAEAVECADISSPYTREYLEDFILDK